MSIEYNRASALQPVLHVRAPANRLSSHFVRARINYALTRKAIFALLLFFILQRARARRPQSINDCAMLLKSKSAERKLRNDDRGVFLSKIENDLRYTDIKARNQSSKCFFDTIARKTAKRVKRKLEHFSASSSRACKRHVYIYIHTRRASEMYRLSFFSLVILCATRAQRCTRAREIFAFPAVQPQKVQRLTLIRHAWRG